MLRYQSLLVPVALIAGVVGAPSQTLGFPGFAPLRFTRDGTFQITVFNDLHYGEAENLWWGPAQDVYSTKVINAVLDAESPQLVVLNGDLITGENTYLPNSTHYVDKIVEPLVQRNLVWASTYGNHDSNYNLSRLAIFEREHRYPNSLTGYMVPGSNAGVSNYFLEVFSSDVRKLTPEVILWFFDSRGGVEYQKLDEDGNTITIPEVVDESVALWFRETNKFLTAFYKQTIPSLAFYHIPVQAMAAFQTEGVNANQEPGINDDNPLAQQGQETTEDGDVYYDGADIPFMQALVDTPGLMATFSGHDHGDDWCFKWNSTLTNMTVKGSGVDLCFGRHTGYGGYGNWMRGGRQILLNLATLGKSTETWVRLEDGSESGRVTLNSTYGTDSYPEVADVDTSLPDPS
ncbi:hypothetical protein OIDMADRAFT_147769 [Oidiodendron maius Zn]|uniref:Calcineurin-like phosphoesterase domain-containing protein n=1 Tax=Oidiodendron maius (strain Zn) TaxID=913774 RepID=A0A0C3H478_OIDMZ|nr:hypothetical protein OIDMADRAFT_147769 [Oidiodendron maius Zn]